MHKFIKKTVSYFITGTFVVLPLVVFAIILRELFHWLDRVFPSVTGLEFQVTGIGAIIIVLIILLTGIVTKNYFGKKVIEIGNAVIISIPILNKVFIAVQQIMDVMLKPQKNFLGEVVAIQYPTEGSWALGFVTSRETSEISMATGVPLICVYVPSTPNPTTGIVLYVPESKVVKVNLNAEIVVKASVSGGLVSSATTDIMKSQDRTLGDVLRQWNARKTSKKLCVDPRD
jgi:uncharacterized membrane protein